MRPRRTNPQSLAAWAAAAGLLVAACTAYQAGWTFDPTIGKATGAPAGAASSAGSAASSPTSGPGPTVATGSLAPSAVASGSPGTAGGSVIDLVAKNVTFDQHDLAAPANAAFTIKFDNQDSGIPHNVAIYTDSSKSDVLFRGTVVTGPTQTTYSVQPLPPGTYYFECDVHPSQMNGTIVIH